MDLVTIEGFKQKSRKGAKQLLIDNLKPVKASVGARRVLILLQVLAKNHVIAFCLFDTDMYFEYIQSVRLSER